MDELLAALHSALKTSITHHYKKVSAEYTDLYGYSLYADDPMWGWTARFNCESSLPVQPNDPYYSSYRYVATEWESLLNKNNELELFKEVRDTLKIIREKREQFENIDVHQNILSTCYTVLAELEAEGLFGEQNDSRYLVIFLSDSDDKIIPRSIRDFNSPKVAAEALGCMIFDDP